MEILFLNHIHGLAQTYWLRVFEFNVGGCLQTPSGLRRWGTAEPRNIMLFIVVGRFCH